MKKHSILGMVLVLLLAGCAPSFDKEQEVVQDSEDKKEIQIRSIEKGFKNLSDYILYACNEEMKNKEAKDNE